MTDFDPLDSFRASVVTDDPERSERIRNEFRARIATMATDAEGRRPFDPAPRPLRARRQPVLALVSMVVVLGVATAGAFVLGDRATLTPSLDELAMTAASRADQELEPGQVLASTLRRADVGEAMTLETQWIATDGTGQQVVTAFALNPSAPSVTVFHEPGSLQFAGLHYDELRALPANPVALLDRLRQARGGSSRPSDDALAIAELLALTVTPPDVAAGAMQALAELGGTPIGPTQDPSGRTGVGVEGFDADGTRWLIVLDPATGRAMGFETSGPDGSPGVSRAWIDQRVTNRPVR